MMDELIYFYPEGHEAHALRGHPERPERLETIRSALRAAGWWQAYPQIDPEAVTPEILRKVHSPAYLEILENEGWSGGYLDGDTYLTPSSWELALRSAGGAIAVAKTVWQRKARSGFALCRPPGHHATHQRGMGFCLLNNIALAAEALLQSEGAKGLAIVDLDLHHGNGTQDIFWQRGEVFFLSVHQSPLYPGSGQIRQTGSGGGAQTSANFPVPPGSGDEAYRAIMEEAIVPLLDRFEPEMILVSYGFDPHWRDPLGSLNLSAATYGELITRLSHWADDYCQGRIALFLEGGYDLDAATACSQAVVAALLGKDWRDPLGPTPYEETQEWRKMLWSAKKLWGI